MADDWDRSAKAWIAEIGDHGDYARRHILDPAMLARLDGRAFSTALDVGCGEGRFCRMLRKRGVAAVGLDPTGALIAEARSRDPKGRYLRGRAEEMALASKSFDLVVSYLTLIDIPGLEVAIQEMNRVLTPGGTLLIANLTSFNTAGMETSWVTDESGRSSPLPRGPLSRRARLSVGIQRTQHRELASSPQHLYESAARSGASTDPFLRTGSTRRRPGTWRPLQACALVPRHGMAEACGVNLIRATALSGAVISWTQRAPRQNR